MKTFKMPEPILTTTKEMSDIIPPGTKLYTETALTKALNDILTVISLTVIDSNYNTAKAVQALLADGHKGMEVIDKLREELPK